MSPTNTTQPGTQHDSCSLCRLQAGSVPWLSCSGWPPASMVLMLLVLLLLLNPPAGGCQSPPLLALPVPALLLGLEPCPLRAQFGGCSSAVWAPAPQPSRHTV